MPHEKNLFNLLREAAARVPEQGRKSVATVVEPDDGEVFKIDLDNAPNLTAPALPLSIVVQGINCPVLQNHKYGNISIGDRVRYIPRFKYLDGGVVELFFTYGQQMHVKFKDEDRYELVSFVEFGYE